MSFSQANTSKVAIASVENAAAENGVITLKREITALEIAQALARAGSTFLEPTDEQRAIIESKHWGATVVVAGAGSGKTETMTQRVLWLVVNGVVKPDEILGLTFTRKAAGELASRMRYRMRQLRKVGMIPADEFGVLDIAVDISTYHSYAGRVLTQHGIRMGIDADVAPIGEAAAWQLFSEIVAEFPETLYPLEHSPNSVVDAVISLSSQISEHHQSVESVRALSEALLEKLLTVDSSSSNSDVRGAITTVKERLSILPMVEAADARRMSEGLLTFDDHMNLAARLVEGIPDVAISERSRYKVVLLDEYQDTSASQVRFLSTLFGSTPDAPFPITAVGDPFQAIYGWRGASAGTINRFTSDFAPLTRSERFTLLTSWRNDRKVLDFANQIVDQMAVRSSAQIESVSVDRLTLNPKAGEGSVLAGRYLTARDEAVAIADHFATLWSAPERLALPDEKRSTFAVLIRTKSYIPEIEAALREANLPVEVVGIGGLIHIPEIADIIALLRTLTFPDAGTSLARLLTGPRLSLGAKDLMALGGFARDLTKSSSQGKSRRLEEILERGEIAHLENDDFAIGSIIEAIDQIADAPRERFSQEGLRRMQEFSTELSALRRELHGSITDIVIEAERFLRLDSEVLVRDGWESGRRHLDAFMEEAAHFARYGGTLSTFLQWLDVADKREGGLKPTSIAASRTAVQILTIHTAKGAEWDHIAIPGLVKGNFPSSGKKSDSWLKNSGSIPLELRADASQFPFSYQFPEGFDAPKASIVKNSLTAFDDQWKELRLQEEYRLAYVAFTRARHSVLATSSIYRDGSKEREISEIYDWLTTYLESNDPSAIISSAVDDDGVNPLIENPLTAIWPLRGSRVDAIAESAKLVNQCAAFTVDQLSALRSSPDPQIAGKARDALSIISEIERGKSIQPIFLPDRLSVSSLLSIKSDPNRLALDIRRPMPHHANPFAARGTEFHSWIERHFQLSTLFDDDIFDPQQVADFALQDLKDKWLASEWAHRTPVGVEVGFETVLAGIVVKGRIDAIYSTGDGSFEVIDWKTGKEKSGADLDDAAVQLAVYRLAYAKLHGVALEKVTAGFHYVNENQTVRPADLLDEDGLISLITSVDLDTDR